jgi:microcompartment protein CcmL/EutN
MLADAVAVLELSSIARGFAVVDAVVKEAPVAVRIARAVSPGKFVLLFVGDVASVQASNGVALGIAGTTVVDHLLLPAMHPSLLRGLEAGPVEQPIHNSVVIIETTTVVATVAAADAALKAVAVGLVRLQLAVGMGGKAYFSVVGALADVEAAAAAGREQARDRLVECVIIAQPHPEMRGFL